MSDTLYLNERTTSDVREALLSGLAKLREGNAHRRRFHYEELMQVVAPSLVGETKVLDASAKWAAKQQFIMRSDNRDHPARLSDDEDDRKLRAALWSLVMAGVLYPRLMTPGGYTASVGPDPVVIEGIELTPYGEQVIAGVDHPLRPGFIERFKEQCGPHVTDEIVIRLDDAIQCQDRTLLRAALAMVGLAAEETLRITHGALFHLGMIPTEAKERTNAKDVLKDVRKAVEAWPEKKRDDADRKHRLCIAVVALEEIRIARNEASHPGKKMTDTEYVESILRSAAHNLPVLWRIPIAKAIAEDFKIENKD